VKLLWNGEIMVTTAGRAIFNRAMPEGYPYINTALGLKDISALSADIFNKYGRDVAIVILDSIKELGFKFAGKLGYSISMSEFKFGAEEVLEKRLSEFIKTEDSLGFEYADGFITEQELKWQRM